jgi:hypothetical protein
MTDLEQGELRVVVPVGFLLTEEQEVSVSVERPGGGRLPIRLRLIPACQSASAEAVVCDAEPPPTRGRWPRRHHPDDGYHGHDVGGGD